MRNYIDLNTYKPSEPREDDMPSMTIEGEYKEMSDILNGILNGTPYEQKKVQYISAEDASKITSYFRNGLDLTDLDRMKSQNEYQSKVINDAIVQRQKDIHDEIELRSKEQVKDSEDIANV